MSAMGLLPLQNSMVLNSSASPKRHTEPTKGVMMKPTMALTYLLLVIWVSHLANLLKRVNEPIHELMVRLPRSNHATTVTLIFFISIRFNGE